MRRVAFSSAAGAALVVSASFLVSCTHPAISTREPSSVESLCLAGPPVHQRAYKLPSVEGLRNDRLIKGQDLHVDLEASRRVVAATVRALPGAAVEENSARTFIMHNGGGIFVWWRSAPVSIVYQPADAKAKKLRLDVYGAAIAETPPLQAGRTLYLLERPVRGEPARWRAFETSDHEHVCP